MAHQNEIDETQAPTIKGTGRFEKGNRAAAKPSKKAIAEMLCQRLEKEGSGLPITQLTALAREFNKATAKRRRRHPKEPKSEKVSHGHSTLDSLPPEEQEIFREVFRIEAERLEAGRKKWQKEWEAGQKERNGNTLVCPPPLAHDQPIEKPHFRLVPDV